MANEYATVAELKQQITSITTTSLDAELQEKLTAASRRIDRDTNRRFYQDSVTSTRTYAFTHPTLILVDDISTTTGLTFAINGATLDSTNYEYLPENAIAKGLPIEAVRNCFGWPCGWGQKLQVTAKWGWAAVPDEIKEATLLLASRLMKRRDSPDGVAGNADYGVVRVSRYDPDYDNLIGPFIRPVV